MRTAMTIVGLTVLVGAGWLAALSRSNRLVWDHFDVVKPGVLYRSGQLEPGQLRDVVKRYHLKTVVNLQVYGRDLERERALAKELGIDFVHLPMPGDGAGREDQFREILKVLDTPERCPVLVHCARGTCRTGASVALYRFERDGWTVEDVAAEMERQAYRDGWLPGYVYAMVKEKPFHERFEPAVERDDNLARATGTAPRPTR